jgi:MFS family permease
MNARSWAILGFGALTAVVAGFGLTLTSEIIAAIVGTAAATVAVVYASSAAGYVVLAVAIVGLAVPSERPPAWQVLLVAGAVAGFVLAPELDRSGLTAGFAAAAGIPLAGAATVLAQHVGRGSAAYLAGLAALVVALFLAVRPAMRATRRPLARRTPRSQRPSRRSPREMFASARQWTDDASR